MEFQYPLADRRRCNQQRGDGLLWRAVRFSILLRIVGDVTVNDREISFQHGRFQYPLADRRRCNRRLNFPGNAPEQFQYPLADRRRCNLHASSVSSSATSSFSILLRIVGDVTPLTITTAPDHGRFSILLRIVGDVTAG
mgnify:CR=1 FL=1